MPLSPDDASAQAYLRLLVLGAPKVGKTHCILATCEKPAYVINCDDAGSLRPASRVTKEFKWDLVAARDAGMLSQMENAIGEARRGVKAGEYKTIVWDTMSSYAMRLEQVLADSTDTGKGPDGRRYWPDYEKRLRSVVERLFSLKAHIIVMSHYIEVGGEVTENQMAKSGQGIVPLLGGKARGTIPALFQDVVFLEKKRTGRVFTTALEGVFGPGCRSLDGVAEMPADVGEFWRRATGGPGARKKVSK